MERNLHYQQVVVFSLDTGVTFSASLTSLGCLFDICCVWEREKRGKENRDPWHSSCLDGLLSSPATCWERQTSVEAPFLGLTYRKPPESPNSLPLPSLPFILCFTVILCCCSLCYAHRSWNNIIVYCKGEYEETNSIAFCVCVCVCVCVLNREWAKGRCLYVSLLALTYASLQMRRARGPNFKAILL